MSLTELNGAWMTDIDDTLVYSGEMPDDRKIDEIAEFIRILKKHNIIWVPMSGVAMVKLGPRILYRLPDDILSNVIYYGGDGSLKYMYNPGIHSWLEDKSFSSLFTESQAYIILGDSEYRKAITEMNAADTGIDKGLDLNRKIEEIREILKEKGYQSTRCILDVLKDELKKHGVDPNKSEAYFRGGSVSWMMLGDISADPYHTADNISFRKKLIEISKKWLEDNGNLKSLGTTGINVPFPGARGIKFVLSGNDKERSAREMIKSFNLKPENVLFSGNELFDGGNDNMIRNIDEVQLLSVGDREDSGPCVINGRIKSKHSEIVGVEANSMWMNYVIKHLESGEKWQDILISLKDVQL